MLNTRAWGRRVVLELTHPEVAHGRAGRHLPAMSARTWPTLVCSSLGAGSAGRVVRYEPGAVRGNQTYRLSAGSRRMWQSRKKKKRKEIAPIT